MSFLSKLGKGLKGAMNAVNSDEYQVNGVKAKCIHCGHSHFELGSAQLNTAGMTFLNLDWANGSASLLSCKGCSKSLGLTLPKLLSYYPYNKDRPRAAASLSQVLNKDKIQLAVFVLQHFSQLNFAH